MRTTRRGAIVALEPEASERVLSLEVHDDPQLRQLVHELNNLLTVINGYADVLLDDCADHLPAHQLAMIRDAGKRAAALVAELRVRGQRRPSEPGGVARV